MAVRRIDSSSRVRSGWRSNLSRLRRSSAGITRSFDTMVLSATVSTMIMLVAADSPPRKANSASAFPSLRQRQGQDEHIGVHRAGLEMHQTGRRNRQHEQVDQQHVEWEQPERPAQMHLPDVLDDYHLELARQADDNRHGQQRDGDPASVAQGRLGGQQAGDLRMFRRSGEQVGEAVMDAPDHRDSRQERQQLDHALERDGGDHALMVLGGIDVPRAERDGEGRHQQGHVERLVLRIAAVGPQPSRIGAGQQVEADRYRLQLKRL